MKFFKFYSISIVILLLIINTCLTTKNLIKRKKSADNVSPDPSISNLTKGSQDKKHEAVIADKQTSDEKYSFNNYINKGVNMLKNDFDVFTNLSTIFGENQIFSYNIDIGKALSEEGYSVSGLKFDIKEEKDKKSNILIDYTYKEIEEAMNTIIKSVNLPIHTENFLINRARTITDLPKKVTFVYTNTLKKLNIELDDKHDSFPKLQDKFIVDSIKIFGNELYQDLSKKDDYLSLAYEFIEAYGSHYNSKIKFGSRMTFIGDILKPFSKNGPVPKMETNIIKSGQFAFDDNIIKNNRLDSSNDVMIKIGHCTYDSKTNEFIDCNNNFSKLAVIEIEIKPIYELFKPEGAKLKNFKTSGGVEVNAETKNKIYNNLKKIIDGLFTSIDIRNAPISDLYIMNNLKNEDLKFNSCLKTRKKVFKDKNMSVFGEHIKVDTTLPVYGFKTDSLDINYNSRILVTNKDQMSSNEVLTSSYACFQRSTLFNQYALHSFYKFNNVFIKKIYFKNMDQLEEDEIKKCNVLWTRAPKEAKTSVDIIHYYICKEETSNPFDNDIITDLKIRKFNDNKCENNFDYLGRKYTCICDYNMLKAGNSNANKGQYLCYSKKIPIS